MAESRYLVVGIGGRVVWDVLVWCIGPFDYDVCIPWFMMMLVVLTPIIQLPSFVVIKTTTALITTRPSFWWHILCPQVHLKKPTLVGPPFYWCFFMIIFWFINFCLIQLLSFLLNSQQSLYHIMTLEATWRAHFYKLFRFVFALHSAWSIFPKQTMLPLVIKE